MKTDRTSIISLILAPSHAAARPFLKKLARELEEKGGKLTPKWDPKIVKALASRAKTAGQRAAVSAIRSIYHLIPASAEHADELLARLQKEDRGLVIDAHRLPQLSSPAYVGAFEPASIVTPEFMGSAQSHLDPAPAGINARYAWQFAGAGGENVHVYVMEGAWSRVHPELASLQIYDIDQATPANAAAGILPLAATNFAPPASSAADRDHGAKVLSLLFAEDAKPAERFSETSFATDSFTSGVVGLVPYASKIAIGTVHDTSQSTVNGNTMSRAIAAAIHSAATNPTVLLVERQIAGATKAQLGSAWDTVIKPAPSRVPFDSTLDSYTDFVCAVEFGVHVIMPMANGSDQTLDGAAYALDKVYGALRAQYTAAFGSDPINAQPIRVAAATRVGAEWKFNDPGSPTDTNYAEHADCFGPVLVTCCDQASTISFGQTSAASAIIAGAAACILGRAHAKGVTISPNELRTTFRLAANGQTVVDALPAQVVPNLQQIFYSKFRDYRPDLYFRKKSKLERWSPDIIIYPKVITGGAVPSTKLLNQLYGEGSGRENDVIGPRYIIPGATYAVCARVRNRGASAARNPLFRFFSAPHAPAGASSPWSYVGSSWLPMVKTGRVAQVSPAVLWTAPSRAGHASFVAEVTCGGDNAQPDRTSVSTWPSLVQLALAGDNLAFRSAPYVFMFRRNNYFVGESWINVFSYLSRAPLVFEVETNVPKGSLISVLTAGESEEKWVPIDLQGGRARLADRVLADDEQLQLQLRVEIPADASKEEYSLAFLQKLEGVEVGRADLIFLDPGA